MSNLCGWFFQTLYSQNRLTLHSTHIPRILPRYQACHLISFLHKFVWLADQSQNRIQNLYFWLKWVHPIIFASNVFHNSHLIQKCIQNQQLLLILYTLLNQMRVVKNIRCKDDRITSLYYCFWCILP